MGGAAPGGGRGKRECGAAGKPGAEATGSDPEAPRK